jgi:hypothetical protein
MGVIIFGTEFKRAGPVIEIALIRNGDRSMIDHDVITRACHLLLGVARRVGMIRANANHEAAK